MRVATVFLVLGLASWLTLASVPVAPAVRAQPASDGSAASAERPLDLRVAEGRVSLDARGVPLGDLLRAIGERANVPVHLDGDLSTPVTRAFTDVPLDEAIQRLARGHSLSFAYAPPESPAAPGRLAEVWVIAASSGPTVRAAPRVAAPIDPRARALRLRAVRTLAARRDGAAIVELAQLATQEADPIVRAQAVAALGRVAGPQATGALTTALGDHAPAVRIQAVRSLQRVAREEAADPIARVLATDPEPRVRRAAAWVLGGLRSPTAETALRTAATGDADESVRRSASAALGRWERARR